MKIRKKKVDAPIRILQVVGSMNYGGIQSYIMNLYRNIDNSKVQFDFIVHTDEEQAFDNEIKSLGGKIFNCPKYTGKNHFQYKAWWKVFFREHADYCIIHGHVRSTAGVYLKIANQFNLVTISHSHSTSSGKGLKSIVKNVMQFPIRYRAEYLFSCSKSAGIWLFGNKACESEKFYIMNNSIKAEEFTFNEFIRHEKIQEFNLEDKFVLGHVGRFTREKNHLGLINIFKEVHNQKGNSVLLIVGDGELRPMLEEKVEKLGLKDSVIFTGFRSDISDIMQAMDIFVFPSLWEGLGIVVIEAEAAGLRCIVADTVPEEIYITDLVETVSLNETPETWANKIIDYDDGYERKNMLEDIIKHRYDIKENAKWVENFYLKVANQ